MRCGEGTAVCLGGKLELHLNIRTGRISDLKFSATSSARCLCRELAEKLNGRQYRESDVAAALEEVDFSQYFLGISPEEFLECMFS